MINGNAAQFEQVIFKKMDESRENSEYCTPTRGTRMLNDQRRKLAMITHQINGALDKLENYNSIIQKHLISVRRIFVAILVEPPWRKNALCKSSSCLLKEK